MVVEEDILKEKREMKKSRFDQNSKVNEDRVETEGNASLFKRSTGRVSWWSRKRWMEKIESRFPPLSSRPVNVRRAINGWNKLSLSFWRFTGEDEIQRQRQR